MTLLTQFTNSWSPVNQLNNAALSVATPLLLNTLPHILRREVVAGETVYELFLPPDLPCFRGHFPRFPLVPGVAQLNWVAELAGVNLEDWQSVKLERLKFQKPMLPGQEVVLNIALQQRGCAAAVVFRYCDAAGQFSSGILIVEPQDVSTLRINSGL